MARDANEYKPIRDAVAHTALLADSAKAKLSTERENIKGRVKTIFVRRPKLSLLNCWLPTIRQSLAGKIREVRDGVASLL